jgi:hypothetical protein
MFQRARLMGESRGVALKRVLVSGSAVVYKASELVLMMVVESDEVENCKSTVSVLTSENLLVI